MSFIESTKSYTDSELETVFFRPMLTGAAADDLGIRVLYNMPVPTTIHLWPEQNNILQSYTQGGWSPKSTTARTQKTVNMTRVKAEMAFSASDYFSMVFENMATNADIDNLDDLTGTELEAAETELFRRSIAESLRLAMWAGDSTLSSGINTFDGFLKKIYNGANDGTIIQFTFTEGNSISPEYIIDVFDEMWERASDELKNAKGDGQLAIFVTSDIYTHYEKVLDNAGVDSSHIDLQSGRKMLMYHGVEIIDIRDSRYHTNFGMQPAFAILTDKRNLVMSVNTADFPGSEIRMWYNPDEMENRQRATFAVGCEIIDESAIVFATI